MQYLEYLKLVLKSNLFSGFIGSIIGGIVTWLVTKDSLKKQFQYQNKLVKLERKKQEKVALKSVKSEIAYNLIYLDSYEKTMINENIGYINFKASNSNVLLKINKWEKHSDTILNIEQLEYIGELQGFYITISAETIYQMVNLERVGKLIENALKLSKLLEDTIKTY